MSEPSNKTPTEPIQEKLEKIVEVVSNNVSSSNEYCKAICETLKDKSRTEEEEELWNQCACGDETEER